MGKQICAQNYVLEAPNGFRYMVCRDATYAVEQQVTIKCYTHSD